MRIYFDDGNGRLRPGDDRELKPGDVTFTIDAAGCCIIGGATHGSSVIVRRTCLKGQSRGLAELRIYEALRVEVARRNPIAEEL